jgi:uncharacterized protein (TIGR02284 family)
MDRDDILDTIEGLIENCNDGEAGFRASAERVGDAELRELFEARAKERKLASQELQTLMVEHGGSPDTTGGSVAGAVHRGWVALKGTVSGHTALSVLEEVERGEDAAVARYRKALDADLPEDVRSLVTRQFQAVERSHAQMRALRDAQRAGQAS